MFAAGVRLLLLETLGTKPRMHVYKMISPRDHALQVHVGLSDGRLCILGVVLPKDGRPCFHISLSTPGEREWVIAGTPVEVFPLVNFVVGLMLAPPDSGDDGVGEVDASGRIRVSYITPHAATRADASRHALTLGEHDLAGSPRIGDLFDDPAFWALASAFRETPDCRTTAGAFADWVRDRGFERLATTLQTNPRTAIRMLPTKAACPSRFVKQMTPLRKRQAGTV